MERDYHIKIDYCVEIYLSWDKGSRISIGANGGTETNLEGHKWIIIFTLHCRQFQNSLEIWGQKRG
jgi:hypothetical protein